MLNISHLWGNTNQNHNGCRHPIPTRRSDAKLQNKEVLDRMWRNWNSHLLLLFCKVAQSWELLGAQRLGLGAFTAVTRVQI